MNNADDAWFEPKIFGYGAGLPIAWQGWVLLGAYLLIVVASSLLIRRRMVPEYLVIMIVATVVFGIICEAKTRGGWHWRTNGRIER